MDISTVLKIAGILIAGLLGVLGTVTDTRDKQTNVLTHWGRWVIALTVAGAALALGAQIFDSISQTQQNHTILTGLQTQSTNTNNILKQDSDILSQIHQQSTTTNDILNQNSSILKSTHDQSTIATASLRSVQDLLSQFDEVRIDSEFELPQSDPRVAALAADLHRWANSAVPAGTTCQGFNPGKRNATIICTPFDASQQAIKAGLPSTASLSSIWQALPIMTGRVWISRKSQPLAALVGGNTTASDLFMFNADFGADNQGNLIYYESNKKVYLKPTRFYSNSKNHDCWFANTILGIHDLAGAQIVVEFNWKRAQGSDEPDPLLSKIRPDYLNLEAGHTSLFLRKFTTTAQAPQGIYAPAFILSEFTQAVLPDEEGILSRDVRVPPARMTN